MFDVQWTDPGTEKVGERKARKEREQDFQDGQQIRQAKRGSTSTRRSSSSADKSTLTKSTGEKASSLFGSFGLKKNRLSSKSKIGQLSDLRIPIPEANTVTPSLPTASTSGSTFSSTDFLGETSPDSQMNSRLQYKPDSINRSWVQLERSPVISMSTKESVLSRTTQVIVPPFHLPLGDSSDEFTILPWAQAVQDLGRDSWITRTTETLTEAKPETGSDCTRSTPTLPLLPRVPADPHTPASLTSFERDMSRSTFGGSMYDPSPLSLGASQTPSRPQRGVRSKKGPRSLMPKPITGFGGSLPADAKSKRMLKFTAHDPSCWKAPSEWDVEEVVPKLKGFNLEEHFSAVRRPANDSLADIASVQREIKKMALLVPASILFRLEEKLSDLPNPAAYKETELERKRLMLFALGAFGTPSESGSPKKGTKILALFESEAAASYLAAIRPESSITHLSPAPLSALLFPNVRPLVSPTVSTSALSVAPNYFSDVYCLPLPSVLTSHDIPALLRNIHTCLLPGGSLHLVLIDPAPATDSLGPRMRHWMEDNLLLNLERQFRCIYPRRLIPLWLADVGLRCDDHTVRCQAVFQKQQQHNAQRPRQQQSSTLRQPSAESEEEEILNLLYGGEESRKREQQAKLELRSRIARLLWQETWGGYVNAKTWWWDDAECVEECLQLGTYWDYSVVEAVKDN